MLVPDCTCYCNGKRFTSSIIHNARVTASSIKPKGVIALSAICTFQCIVISRFVLLLFWVATTTGNGCIAMHNSDLTAKGSTLSAATRTLCTDPPWLCWIVWERTDTDTRDLPGILRFKSVPQSPCYCYSIRQDSPYFTDGQWQPDKAESEWAGTI